MLCSNLNDNDMITAKCYHNSTTILWCDGWDNQKPNKTKYVILITFELSILIEMLALKWSVDTVPDMLCDSLFLETTKWKKFPPTGVLWNTNLNHMCLGIIVFCVFLVHWEVFRYNWWAPLMSFCGLYFHSCCIYGDEPTLKFVLEIRWWPCLCRAIM